MIKDYKNPNWCRFRVPDNNGFDDCGAPVYVADRCQEHAVKDARELASKIAKLDAERSALVARMRELGCGHMLPQNKESA